MFCSECGAKAAGKFCSHCGARLHGAAEIDSVRQPAPVDWRQLMEYEALLKAPEVRDRIARAAAVAKKSLTGEEFLDLCGKAIGNLAGVPLPMSSVARFAQSLHGKLGIKTGKERRQFVASPPGEVLVSLLCSLARDGRTVRRAHQMTDGCILVAELSSDLFALEGDLIISVSRRPGGVQVEAKTHIEGQLFDWGKSTRCLDKLFSELSSAAAA